MALVRWNPVMPWRPSQEPWSPFTEIESLRSGMDRLFDAFSGTMPPSGANEALWYPRVDLQEHVHIPRMSATQSMGRLPPNPREACQPVHGKAATQST